MQDQQWDAWVKRHAVMFALTSPNYGEMFAEWRIAFEYAGYSARELDDATTWLAANDAPRWPVDHLNAIRRRVGDVRRQEARSNAELSATATECQVCRGCGWVRVPHPKDMLDGVWMTNYLAAVVCDKCERGRRVQASFPTDGRRQMSLTEYEQKVPHWFDVLRVKRKEAEAMETARRATFLAQGGVEKDDCPQLTAAIRKMERRIQAMQN